MNESSIILEVKHLKKVFKDDLFKKPVVAVSDISARFVEGTINTIIGHNGAGKTTTIRIILGLLSSQSGEVLFRGKPITIKDRQKIGYMPEIHRLSGLLTPYETLSGHLRYYAKKMDSKTKKELIQHHLNKLGVWDHRTKKLQELSKGLQRRLAYCLAVIHEPQFLILDEPFSGLDPLGHEMMEGLLGEQRAKNNTIIMSSHDVDAMIHLCDHYHVFQKGKSVYSSLDDNDFTTHRNPSRYRYEIRVSGSDKNQLEGLLAQNEELSAPDAWSDKELSHHMIYPSYKSALQVVKHFMNQGVVISSFQSLGKIEKDHILNYFKAS
ncbi:MAG: ATP-binding cassette domain-containing protein [Proteobacteria bacterium]|nr:ATP-binding cassette domain-containing protein [Pseudomonadota bacterium]